MVGDHKEKNGNLYKNIWGKISKSVGRNYRKASGEFRRRTKWLRNFVDEQDGYEIISQPKADFATLRNWPSTWSDWLPMVVTPSFELRIAHHSKHWIADFLSFETTYSMHKLDFRKYSKSGWHDCHKKCFMADFSLLPLLAFQICLWQRTSKLRFFMFLSFPLLCHGFQITLLNLILLWWSKSYQNTKT